jgi:hypothetical protein
MPKKDATKVAKEQPTKCESCGENEPAVKLVAMDLQGKELDSMTVCVECCSDPVSELLPGVEDARGE